MWIAAGAFFGVAAWISMFSAHIIRFRELRRHPVFALSALAFACLCVALTNPRSILTHRIMIAVSSLTAIAVSVGCTYISSSHTTILVIGGLALVSMASLGAAHNHPISGDIAYSSAFGSPGGPLKTR